MATCSKTKSFVLPELFLLTNKRKLKNNHFVV
nr:MAG TPA: hypothetical protein [Caudoviricetes sp.]